MSSSFETEIEKLVYGGSGLGRCRGKVVFVPYSVPGDRLLVRSVQEKKSYIRAEIVEILAAGPGRVDPVCPHFGRCGGCQWQHLQYALQAEAKLRILGDACRHRFPQARDVPIGMKACPKPLGYRSRARVQLRGEGSRRYAGFFRPGSHAVEAVGSCPLLRPPLNRALASLGDIHTGSNIDPGMREIDIACSCEDDKWIAAPVGSPQGPGNARAVRGGKAAAAEDILVRKVGGFQYSVTASAFFQANDFMISDLVRLVRELAHDSPRGAAADLFAGVGLFSLPLASHFESVTAVENSPEASRLCSRNVQTAAAGSVRTVAADVERWLESRRPDGMDGFDLVLLDPPRSGAGTGIMKKIAAMAPGTILYVSCDPQTLCRDLSSIPPEEYRIDRIEGLDMFPQTYHFETVVRMVRR
ncbi:MAG: class I SAM-dependent RNA methyltransferase [Acidobacteria bacterium]|nr:class I SAM-dependent RNA methyltransferase [Acidobacteriota bacterium]